MSYDSSMNQPNNKPVLSTAVRASRGFTLVEILIVLALIGIIAGLAMSNLGEIFSGGQEQAAQTWVNSTGEAYVTSYFARVGSYPKALSDLKNPPNDIPPFVKRKKDLEDPWGNEYEYKVMDKNSYELRSYGEDGMPQTEDDITWPLTDDE